MPEARVRTTIICDNRPGGKQLIEDPGFSALVETPHHTILFDTNSRGSILMANMMNLNLTHKDIEMIFLSHHHWDHIGGLDDALQQAPYVDVYAPDPILEKEIQLADSHGAKIIPVKKSIELAPGIYSTGIIKQPIPEHSLVIESEKGLVLITGCAHPGILELAKLAVQVADGELFLVLGGFHLEGMPREKYIEIAEELKDMTRHVAPGHCNTDEAIDAFGEVFGEFCHPLRVGEIIDTDDLD